MKPKNVLDARLKYQLSREVDVYANSPRKLQLTSAEFIAEVSKEIGHTITIANLEAAVASVGLKLTDVFKCGSPGGKSVFAEIYKLAQRIDAIEKKIEGL